MEKLQNNFEQFAIQHEITHATILTPEYQVKLSIGEPYTKLKAITNHYGHVKKHLVPHYVETAEDIKAFRDKVDEDDRVYWVKTHRKLRENRSSEAKEKDRIRNRLYQRRYRSQNATERQKQKDRERDDRRD